MPPLPAVWIFQPRVEHYRIPVFDELARIGRDRYALTVLGPLQDGKAFGGESRSYLRHTPHESFRRLGVGFVRWPEAAELIRRERPAAVIVTANPRSDSARCLPAVCRAVGTHVLGWSKVHSYSGLREILMRGYKRRFFGRFERMVVYGNESKCELITLGYPADQIFVAQNTIDTRRIFTQASTIAARAEALRRQHGLTDRRILLCIGKMEPVKRFDDLLRAWPHIRALDSALTLVLVGGGPMLDAVRERARAVDPQRILVTGRVPENDDYAWIAACDAFIVPGGVGLAINQALALARPTIIADEAGADSEIVAHGQTGWRFPRGDLNALVATVGRVLRDPAGTLRVAAEAARMMRDEVTLERMAGQIDAAIGSVLNDHKPQT